MADHEVVYCQMSNYIHDKQFVNKFNHNMNVIIQKMGRDNLIGKKFEVLKPVQKVERKKKYLPPPATKMNLPKLNEPKTARFKQYISVDKYKNYKHPQIYKDYLNRRDSDADNPDQVTSLAYSITPLAKKT